MSEVKKLEIPLVPGTTVKVEQVGDKQVLVVYEENKNIEYPKLMTSIIESDLNCIIFMVKNGKGFVLDYDNENYSKGEYYEKWYMHAFHDADLSESITLKLSDLETILRNVYNHEKPSGV